MRHSRSQAPAERKENMEYPKENIVLLLHLEGGRRTKGFFYMNGTKPTFASYGTEITDKVIGWEYITQTKKGGN